MIRREEVFQIGRIGKPHGVKGETSLQLSDDVFDRVDADFLVLDIDGILVPFYMEEYRFRSDTVALVKFCDIDTQEQARQLTGCTVWFPHALADTRDDTPSWVQLAGWHLCDAASQCEVGTISAVDDSTMNVLFQVCMPDGREVLVPAAEALIVAVDTRQHTITMDIPQGLLDGSL